MLYAMCILCNLSTCSVCMEYPDGLLNVQSTAAQHTTRNIMCHNAMHENLLSPNLIIYSLNKHCFDFGYTF